MKVDLKFAIDGSSTLVDADWRSTERRTPTTTIDGIKKWPGRTSARKRGRRKNRRWRVRARREFISAAPDIFEGRRVFT